MSHIANPLPTQESRRVPNSALRKMIERKHICYGCVIGALPPSHISKSFDYNGHGGPYLLPELPHISADFKRHECDVPGQFWWYEATSGVGDLGTITLAQHVLKLHDWRETAWRIAKFCVPGEYGCTEIHPRFFANYKAVLAEIMGE
jgi:hypothetical protein